MSVICSCRKPSIYWTDRKSSESSNRRSSSTTRPSRCVRESVCSPLRRRSFSSSRLSGRSSWALGYAVPFTVGHSSSRRSSYQTARHPSSSQSGALRLHLLLGTENARGVRGPQDSDDEPEVVARDGLFVHHHGHSNGADDLSSRDG